MSHLGHEPILLQVVVLYHRLQPDCVASAAHRAAVFPVDNMPWKVGAAEVVEEHFVGEVEAAGRLVACLR